MNVFANGGVNNVWLELGCQPRHLLRALDGVYIPRTDALLCVFITSYLVMESKRVIAPIAPVVPLRSTFL